MKKNIKSFIFKIFLWSFSITTVVCIGVYFFIDFTQENAELNEVVRSNLAGKFIKLSQGFVHYELAGPDTGQTVILIHGAGSGYYAWNKNFDTLVLHGNRTLRYDLYGRGFSDRPKVTYDPALFEQQLVELVDSLHLKSPITLISVSMGAIVAIKFATKYSSKVNKLIFIDPAALNDSKKPLRLKTPIVSDALMTLYWYPRAIDKQMKEYFDPKSVKEYAELSKSQMKYKGFKSAMKSTWLHTLNQNLKFELDEIGMHQNIKVLLLWGKYDPLIPPTTSEKYSISIPNTEFHEIDSAGHLANYERPKEVNRFLLNFLSE